MAEKWWTLKHDPETDKWELADGQSDAPSEDLSNYYYDGFIWAADVLAETFEQAVLRVRQLEMAFFEQHC